MFFVKIKTQQLVKENFCNFKNHERIFVNTPYFMEISIIYRNNYIHQAKVDHL